VRAGNSNLIEGERERERREQNLSDFRSFQWDNGAGHVVDLEIHSEF